MKAKTLDTIFYVLIGITLITAIISVITRQEFFIYEIPILQIFAIISMVITIYFGYNKLKPKRK
jgi:hypothetical protein